MHIINKRLEDIKNKTERCVIDKLNKDPRTSDWSCFHSLMLPNYIGQKEGEIDLLILAPYVGIFVIEIKGGDVKQNNGRWYCGEHSINRTPLVQAHDNYYSLLKNFENGNFSSIKKIVSGYGVICFQTDDEKNPFNKNLIYDSRNYYSGQKYYDFIVSLKNHNDFKIDNRQEPNPRVIDEIKQFLMSCSKVEDSSVDESFTIKEINEKLEILTDRQKGLLEMLGENDRILVHGSFGTGKTVLACAYALRCASEGQKVAIVVYNDLIAIELKKCFLNTKNIEIIQIHEFIKDMLIKYTGFDSDRFGIDNQARYESISKEAQNHFDVFKPCFDVIIGDECQDYFNPIDLKVIDRLLFNGLENGKWLFLGDFVNQLLFNQNSDNFYHQSLKLLKNNFNLNGKFTIFPLEENCRNHSEIREEINRLLGNYKDNIDIDETNNNRKRVEYIEWKRNAPLDSPYNQTSLIEKKIKELIDSGVKERQITILTYKKWDGEQDSDNVVSKIKIKHILPKKKEDNHHITHSTFRRYKGLENDVIIIADVDEVLSDKGGKQVRLNYIRDRYICAISRAKTRLIIFETFEARSVREDLFYKGKVSW